CRPACGAQNSAYRRDASTDEKPPVKRGFFFWMLYFDHNHKNNRLAHMQQSESSFSSSVLALLVLLVPIFFVPSAFYPFQFSKVILALLAVTVIFIAYAVKTLRSGNLSIQLTWLSGGLVVLPLAYLASSIFSSVPSLSF